MPLIAKFIGPKMDKGCSFQVCGSDLPPRCDFLSVMADPIVKAARPYLQGYVEREWAMIEFWVGDETISRAAADRCAKYFRIPLGVGDFTRQELGLD